MRPHLFCSAINVITYFSTRRKTEMKLKPILFWTHLSAGVLAGIFILALSITGVILTYEHQIIGAFAKSETVNPPKDGVLRTLDELAEVARERSKGAMVVMLNLENRENTPVVVHPVGGKDLPEFMLNPYTGEDFWAPSADVKSFFEMIVGWHRWLAFEGSSRGMGRQITGAANLVFMFLVLTGIYLWLPRVWKWSALQAKIIFIKNPPPGKARDFNWHHVFSFWALIPLFVVVGTAIVISYPWANAALYRAFGSEPPKQGGPALFGELRKDAEISVSASEISKMAPLQEALEAVKKHNPDWVKMIVFVHPKQDVPMVRLIANNSHAVLPENMETVVYDRREKKITHVRKYDDMSAAEKARMWVRFSHTGEQYGVIGSTLAGLSTLATIFLVYTGLALAYRRLVAHLQKKKK